MILKVLDDKKHIEEIKLCAQIFKEKENHTYAKQALLKLKDYKGLMALHIEMQKWDEALTHVQAHQEFSDMFYLPYADWLSTNDWFEEAQEAYKKAWRPDMAIWIVGFLAQNAVIEKRFNDAA